MIFLMTCSIRDGAEKKIWGRVNELQTYKRQGKRGSTPVKIGILGKNYLLFDCKKAKIKNDKRKIRKVNKLRYSMYFTIAIVLLGERRNEMLLFKRKNACHTV